MIDNIINTIKTHKDRYNIIAFDKTIFNEQKFSNMAEDIVKLFTISDVINRREQLIYFFYNIEDDYDMGVSTETLDNLVDKLLKIN